jgi:hypothetical protein
MACMGNITFQKFHRMDDECHYGRTVTMAALNYTSLPENSCPVHKVSKHLDGLALSPWLAPGWQLTWLEAAACALPERACLGGARPTSWVSNTVWLNHHGADEQLARNPIGAAQHSQAVRYSYKSTTCNTWCPQGHHHDAHCVQLSQLQHCSASCHPSTCWLLLRHQVGVA